MLFFVWLVFFNIILVENDLVPEAILLVASLSLGPGSSCSGGSIASEGKEETHRVNHIQNLNYYCSKPLTHLIAESEMKCEQHIT